MKPYNLLLLVLLLSGCTPKNSAVSAAAGVPVPGPAAVPGSPTTAQVQTQGTPAAVPSVRPFDESILRGKEFLLELSGNEGNRVRDPDLGLLGTDKGFQDIASRFFNQAASGTVPDTLLAPRWAVYLQGWVRSVKAAGWTVGTVRTGTAVEDKKGGWMVPVKVVQETKVFTGWLFVVRGENGLLVSDVQVSGTEKTSVPIDPETQNQEISSPILR